ncbi:sialidase-2-like [Pristis pectinata]|uniref:sialidase-2-like n=1 Tax=Pristis pectinata TaxID=685728 RepID=UPI00223E3E30|nr:sialidase-2-like [Pristis pectinata]
MEENEHDCLAVVQHSISPRVDLQTDPLPNPDLILFTDGSSHRLRDDLLLAGYAIVDLYQTVEAYALPPGTLAQAVELSAFTRACILAKDQMANIYTDSHYAYGVVHDFGHIWKNRGFVTSAGKSIKRSQLVLNLLEAIQLPKQLAIIKCEAHTSATDEISQGNARADQVAKRVALTQQPILQGLRQSYNLPLPALEPSELRTALQNSSPQEKRTWEKAHCHYKDGFWMASSESVHITDLFQKDNCRMYQIPALLHIPNSNTLLAFAERRHGPRDEDADVLYLRSGTYDKSLKNFQWEDAKPIRSAQLEQYRSMNPCPVYEKNTDTVFLFFIAVEGSKTEQEQISSGKNAARLCYVTSMDKGQTWSETNDLTECTIGHTINTWATFAVGPGHGIQLRNGRLVIPANAHEKQSNNQVRVWAFTFFSDDHGESWQFGNFVSGEECGECQVVSVGQGNASSEQTLVYCNARSNKQKYRVEAFSEDGGKTFTEGQLRKQLVEPPGGCHGSIISFPASDISHVKSYPDIIKYHSQSDDDSLDIILFSHTTSSKSFEDLGIYLNTYSGRLQTWTKPWIIAPGKCSCGEGSLAQKGQLLLNLLQPLVPFILMGLHEVQPAQAQGACYLVWELGGLRKFMLS